MRLHADINTGAALLIWVGCFFALLGLVAVSKAVAGQFPVAVTGLTGAFIGILFKNHSDNQLDLRAAQSPEGTVDRLHVIKTRANGTDLTPPRMEEST